MKTYIVTYNTAYDLAVMVVNEDDIESAMIAAKAQGAWYESEIFEIDTNKKGVVFEAY